MQTTPTPQEQEAADYGQYPDNYEQIVKDYFSHTLFDPYSAVYRIDKPCKGYRTIYPLLIGGEYKFEYGYLITVGLNAKNRFGGYVGEKQYQLFIRNGLIKEVY